MSSCERRRRIATPVGLGGVAWLVAPALGELRFGSLEHVFAFLPVVAMPIVLALASVLIAPRSGAARLHLFARRAQPLASACVLVALSLPTGGLAGALALPWLAFAVVLATAGIAAAKSRARPLASASFVAAHVFLALAAVWFLLSRIGAGPSHFSALDVLLATVHFHFSGFALQVLLAATAQRVPARLASIHRVAAIAGIVGIPLIAAGKLTGIAAPKLLGVGTMIAVTLVAAWLTFAIARATSRGASRVLLVVAGGSITGAMLLAAGFAVGQAAASPWIGVDAMVTTHGLLNAIGFVTCGSLAHLRLAGATEAGPGIDTWARTFDVEPVSAR